MTLQERLESIQKENSRKKEERNRIEGRIEALKQQAMQNFGVDTVEELQEKLKVLEPELEAKRKDIEEKLEQMENYANI